MDLYLDSLPRLPYVTVEAVSTDMRGRFTHGIEVLFPNTQIAYNRFLVMEHINEESNPLQRQMHVKFKGLSHLLWKSREDLSDEQRQRLDEGLKDFPCLRIICEFKEVLRQILRAMSNGAGGKNAVPGCFSAKRTRCNWRARLARLDSKSTRQLTRWSGG